MNHGYQNGGSLEHPGAPRSTQEHGYLLDGTVQHSCRTLSNIVAEDHCTHGEASHNLELTSESKEANCIRFCKW